MIRYDMTRQVGKGSAKSARLLIVPVSLLFFAAPVSESTLTDLTNYQASRSSACLPRLWLTPHVNLSSKRGRGEGRGIEIRVRSLLLLLFHLLARKKFHWWTASSGGGGRKNGPIRLILHAVISRRACAICVYSDNWKIFDLVSKSSSGRELNACVPKGGERFEKGSFLERVESK